LALARLSLLPDGRLPYRLKRHWRNGRTHVLFEPLELIEKLAALSPPGEAMRKFPPLNTISPYHSSLGALEQPGEVNLTPPYQK
jgi:hypothetical protein